MMPAHTEHIITALVIGMLPFTQALLAQLVFAQY